MKRQGRERTLEGGAHNGILFSTRCSTGVSPTGHQGCCFALVVWTVVVLITLTGPHCVFAEEAEPLPRFTQEPQSAIVARRDPVTLRCQVDPPTARLAWLFNGAPLRPGAHPGLQVQGHALHFPRFRHGGNEEEGGEEGEGGGSAGEYRCTATTSAGTVVSRPALLSKPVLRHFSARDDIVITTYEGGYVTIPCTPPYSLPPATLRVKTASGQFLTESEDKIHRLPSGSVVLTDVQRGDSGNYTCVAFNPVSGFNRSASHWIIVRVLPRPQGRGEEVEEVTRIVDNSTATLQVSVGDPVTLECPVAGVGAPSVSWSRGYGDLPHGCSVGHFGSLHISSVALRDVGAYICKTASGEKRQVLLEVQMPPRVSSESPGGLVTAEAGEDVKLICRGGAFPAPSVVWYYNGKKHSSSVKSGGEVHTLLLHRVKKGDEGLYTCELSNLLGHASAVIQLVVIPNPRDGEHRGSSPQRDIPSDDPVLKDPGEAMPANSKDSDNQRNFHLEVANNNRHRHGRKRKKNGKRKHRRKKHKKKGRTRKAKLVPPLAPTITRLSDTSAMVHWTVPENDGLPISLFRVQYREVRPKNGQWQTVDDDISAKTRRYKVTRLKPGGTYKFRMAAVYSNNDNRNSANSRRFHLSANPYPDTGPPAVSPRVVEAKPIIYKNILAIGIKWQYLPTDSSPIDGFYIFYKPYAAKDDYTKEVLRGASIRNHLLTGLDPDTEYSIKMKCFNSVGASDFSNMVVKRTLPLEGQSPPTLPPPRDTEAPPASHHEAGGLDPPVILGIVLGFMLLLLVVFVTMCWWKQRQQKRQSENMESCMKFQDQAHRIYTDSLRKKFPNGGPYPLNGLNGLALPNGHGLPHDNVPRMNVDLSAMTHVDHMHYPSQSTHPYPGKLYHGNGMIPNGTMPGYSHSDHSDNNFNTISHNISSSNITASQGLVPNGVGCVGPLQYDRRNRGEYPPHPYPQSSQSRTSLASFTPLSHHSGQDDSESPSDDLDSPDEEEPLAGESSGPARVGVSSYPYVQRQGHVYSSRDNGVNGVYDSALYYGYEGSYDSMPRSGVMREGGSGFLHWPAEAEEESSSSHIDRHKRRRERSHGEREHTMKDQATNTDLSSNEGTLDFLFNNKSPGSSLSTGSNDSVTDTHNDDRTLPAADPTSVSQVAPSVGVQPAISL